MSAVLCNLMNLRVHAQTPFFKTDMCDAEAKCNPLTFPAGLFQDVSKYVEHGVLASCLRRACVVLVHIPGA